MDRGKNLEMSMLLMQRLGLSFLSVKTYLYAITDSYVTYAD